MAATMFSQQFAAQRSVAPARARRSVAVRASAEAPEAASASTSKPEATVYFTNKAGARITGSMEQYNAAVASGDLYRASSVTGLRPALNSEAVSLGDAMAFAGPGPERINGRLSMLAVVAALGAELSSHETVVKQLSEQPTLVVIAAVLVAAGSLVPLLEGKSVEQQSKGFWNAAAEQTNGRAAMIGFASLLVTEKLAGHALL